jgi:hypothetical protein
MRLAQIVRPALLLCLLLLLAACSAAPTASPAPTQPPSATEPPAATATPIPSSTPAPTQTPFPSPTPRPSETPLPSATPTATLEPALAEVKLAGLSWLEKYKYNLLVSLDFPGPVDPVNYRVTLEDKVYRCEVLPKYPNRLYCNGQGAKVLAVATVRVYSIDAEQPGFEQEVWVPYFNP